MKYDLHNNASPPLCLYMMAFSLVKYDLQKESPSVYHLALPSDDCRASDGADIVWYGRLALRYYGLRQSHRSSFSDTWLP